MQSLVKNLSIMCFSLYVRQMATFSYERNMKESKNVWDETFEVYTGMDVCLLSRAGFSFGIFLIF